MSGRFAQRVTATAIPKLDYLALGQRVRERATAELVAVLRARRGQDSALDAGGRAEVAGEVS